MRIALKEWAVVIAGLAGGRQLFLLRKGGIAEGRGGFEPSHREFLLYPTWEHQQAELIRPEFRADFDDSQPPSAGGIPVGYMGTVGAIWPAPRDPGTLAAMSDLHIWSDRFLRMRYAYRPDLPLYVLLLRTFRLAEAARVPFDPRYGGCRSWVELNEEIDTGGAEPVLSDNEFERAANRIREITGAGRSVNDRY